MKHGISPTSLRPLGRVLRKLSKLVFVSKRVVPYERRYAGGGVEKGWTVKPGKGAMFKYPEGRAVARAAKRKVIKDFRVSCRLGSAA